MRDVIVLKDVYKVYESPAGNVIALRGINLKVKESEVLCIMGPSGSGKTTMMNIISGVDTPSAGEVRVNSLNLTKMGPEELLEFRRKNIGYIFQNFNLVPTLTALENVMLPRLILGDTLKNAEKVAMNLLRRVGLEGKEHRYPEELSGGEQQRVAVAIALANDPKIIVADEPTGELDIINAENIVKLLLEQKMAGKTIIITTHDPRIARMTERIVLLEDGVIKGEYSPTSISYGFSRPLEETSHEYSIRAFLESRLEELSKELEKLVEALKNGEISPEKFVEDYNKIELLKRAYKDEISRLGVITTKK